MVLMKTIRRREGTLKIELTQMDFDYCFALTQIGKLTSSFLHKASLYAFK